MKPRRGEWSLRCPSVRECRLSIACCRSRRSADDPRVRPELPTGTVTFLFTDVEGSTSLLANSAQRPTRTHSPSTERRYARHVPATAGSRSTRRETPSFRVPHSAGRTRCRLGLHGAPGTRRADPCARRRPHGDAVRRRGGLCRPRRPSCGSHRRRGPRGAGARVSSDRVARRHRADRPGRAPVQGSRCAGACLPARRRRVPRSEEPLPDESSDSGHCLPRSQARAPGGRRAPRPRRCTARHAYRTRGNGKDALTLQAAAEVSEGFPDGVHWIPLAPLRDETAVEATFAQALEVRDPPGIEIGRRSSGVRHEAVADRRRQLRAPRRGSCRARRPARGRLPEARCRRFQS